MPHIIARGLTYVILRLRYVEIENHSVQKFPLGGGGLFAAHGLLCSDNVVLFSFFQLIRRERIQISLKGGQMAGRQ